MKMLGGRRHSHSEKVEEPAHEGYQLIGDSQFLRFAESLLDRKRKGNRGVYSLGFCVSGQTISELLGRVEKGFAAVSEKVVVMIGTNDLLRGTSFETMRSGLNQLLNLLLKDAKKIILLTIPPVLKLKDDKDHWNRLKKYNNYIKQFHDGQTIFVGDPCSELIKPNVSPTRNSSTRIDSPNDIRSLELSSLLQRQGKLTNSSCSLKPILKRSNSPSMPPERVVTISPKKIREVRPRSFSPGRTNVDADNEPPPAKKSHPFGFALKAFGGFVHDMKKTESSTTSSRRVVTPQKNGNSSYSSTSPNGHDSFETRWRKIRTPEKNRDSFSSPTPGDVLPTTSPRKVLTPKKKCNRVVKLEGYFNGSYGSSIDDEINIENTYKIRDDCFEQHFGSDSGRIDLIHLNRKGLCVIRGIINELIGEIDKNYV